MAKDKPQEKKEIPRGIYILFKVTEEPGGLKVVSRMKLEKATIADLSNAIVLCELTKEELLEHFKTLTKKGHSQDLED